jgi:3-oxoacyl-[acyl-carrier protein] reductase
MKVMITGASRGLGLALAKSLQAENHVIAISRSGGLSSERLVQIKGDVTDDSFLKAVIKEHSPDALVNNAGIGLDGLLAMQPIEGIDALLKTNLRAPIIASKFFVRDCIRTGRGGSIVNISSITATRGFAGLAVYGATKAALLGLTHSLAREVGPHGFRVNSVLPGYFESDMTAGMGDKKMRIIKRTPLRRLATICDIVSVVEFLLSPRASFITGQAIVVDGGLTC